MYSETGEPSLTKLPPELSEHLIHFLPSLSLHDLPLVSPQLGRQARKELEVRHARLDKEQLMILTEHSQPTNILNTISMVCPGLVILYDSTMTGQSYERISQTGTLALHTQQPLFSTTSSRLSQCILTNHLASRQELRSSSRPKCFSLTSDQQDPSLSPVLVLTIPVNINLSRKVRNGSTWNTCNTDKLLPQLLDRVPVTPVSLSQDQGKAQTTLAREIINQDLELELYFNTDLMQAPNMYEDLDTYIMVVSDPNSDNFCAKMVERFFAKVFRPLKVSWVRLVNI